MTETIDRRKLKLHCRRGMLELDVILLPFFEQHFGDLSDAHQHVFVALLETPDPDLYNWLMGHGEPEQSDFKTLIGVIREKMGIANF